MKDKETERESWDWDDYAHHYVSGRNKSGRIMKRFLKKMRRRLRRIRSRNETLKELK